MEHIARIIAEWCNGGSWDVDFTDEQKEYWLRKTPEAIRALNEAGYAICPRRFVVKRDGSHEPLWPEVQP